MPKNLINFLILLAMIAGIAPWMYGEIAVLAVTSSAGGARGIPGPGSLATVYCTGLTGIAGVVAGQGDPLPRMLAGVRVSYGSVDAPLLAVADLGTYQIVNFQVPWEATSVPSISQGSNRAVLVDIVAPWGQFFTDAEGYVITLHASDYSLVTPGNPARAGEWIVAYGSNFGEVANPPATGVAAPIDRVVPVATGGPVGWNFGAQLVVTGASIVMQMNFIGLAPGLVAVYQVNLRMPDVMPAGDLRFYVQRSRFCGFFFLQGCGRGEILDISATARLRD